MSRSRNWGKWSKWRSAGVPTRSNNFGSRSFELPNSRFLCGVVRIHPALSLTHCCGWGHPRSRSKAPTDTAVDAVIGNGLETVVVNAEGNVHSDVGGEANGPGEVDEWSEVPGCPAGFSVVDSKHLILGHGVVNGVGLQAECVVFAQ